MSRLIIFVQLVAVLTEAGILVYADVTIVLYLKMLYYRVFCYIIVVLLNLSWLTRITRLV